MKTPHFGYLALKNPMGAMLAEIPLVENATRKANCKGDDAITLSFLLAHPISIPAGSYVEPLWDDAFLQKEFSGRSTSTLIAAPHLQNKSDNSGYPYTIELHTAAQKLSETTALYLTSETDKYGSPQWDITGTAELVVRILERNMKRKHPSIAWSFECVQGGATKPFSFDKVSVQEALQKVAETNGLVLSINDSTITLREFSDKGIERVLKSDDFSEFTPTIKAPIGQVWALGGNKNLPQRFKGKPLFLENPIIASVVGKEEVKEFPDVYPHLHISTQKVATSRHTEWAVDEKVKKQIPIYKIKALWKSNQEAETPLKALQLNTGMLVSENEKLLCTFQTGKLAGMEFECRVPQGTRFAHLVKGISQELYSLGRECAKLSFNANNQAQIARIDTLNNQVRSGMVSPTQVPQLVREIALSAANPDEAAWVNNSVINLIDLLKTPHENELLEGEIEIIPNDKYGAPFPDSTLKPSEGDLLLFSGYDVEAVHPDAVKQAQKELQNVAQNWLEVENNALAPVRTVVKEREFRLGDVYTLEDGHRREVCFVESVEYKLCNPKVKSYHFTKETKKKLTERIALVEKMMEQEGSKKEYEKAPLSDSLTLKEHFAINYNSSTVHTIGQKILFNGATFVATSSGHLAPPSSSSSQWLQLPEPGLEQLKEEVSNVLKEKVNASALSELVSQQDLNAQLARKADAHALDNLVSQQDLNAQLARKADAHALDNLVSQQDLYAQLARKADAHALGNLVSQQDLNAQLARKADAHALGNYATQTSVLSIKSLSLRPSEHTIVSNASSNIFAPILNDPEGMPKSLSLLVIEGTNLYLPPAQACAMGTKIYLTGAKGNCPTTPRHGNTIIKPIHIYSSNKRDIYSAGAHHLNDNSNLIKVFNNAEWRMDLECITAGCGLKGWLWINSAEGENIPEITNDIEAITRNIASTNEKLKSVERNATKKGEGVQTSFFNTVNLSGSSLNIAENHHKILARTTESGSNNLTFYFSTSLPNGFELQIFMPFHGCSVHLALPLGASTWGNGTRTLTPGYKYEITKSYINEWGINKIPLT